MDPNRIRTPVFCGSATALVTPFANGRVDFDRFGTLIDRQIAAGTDALVAVGTTGENAALSDREQAECIRFCAERTAGRVPVIAGSGSNDTAHAIKLSRAACRAGADALLVVTPYYNKTTPDGLIRHFSAIADAADRPVLLYDVPSRTGLSVPLPVLEKLAGHGNIAGIKAAGNDVAAVGRLIAAVGDALPVYSGCDELTVPLLALGARGAISVLGNLVPGVCHDVCRLWFEGKADESAALSLSYADLTDALFCEVNPIPVKGALALIGLIREEYRLPLCPMTDGHKRLLIDALGHHDLLPISS